MTTSTELEAVAKAIYNAESEDGERARLIAWERRAADSKEPYYRMARAALMAIREPTDEMLTAMSRTHPANTTTRWNIAIDHILGDET
jgi:hypothetical protein